VTSLDELKAFADAAVDQSKERATGVIVKVVRSTGSQIRFSQSQVDISNRWEELTLELFVVVQEAKTCSSTRSIASEREVRQAVDDTISFAERLPDSALFSGVEESVSKYDEVQGQFDDRIGECVEKGPGMIDAAIDAALKEGAKRAAGALKFAKEITCMRSSWGPEGATKRTVYDFNVRAFQNELDYSGQGLQCGVKLSKSERQLVEAGAEAGRLSKQALGAKQGKPGVYDLVLSPTVAANVMGYLPQAANPFLIMIGASPLGDKMGQALAPEEVNVYDDPRQPEGLSCRPFDFEGTPSRKTSIIEKGILKSLIHNTSTAKMHETQSTGNSELVSMGEGLMMLLPGPSNTVFDKGSSSLDSLLEGARPTIYVTSNWYTRWQNYQTSDFSTIPRDAMFLVKGGQMKPIKNLRISDNILRMFANMTGLGNDRKQVYWWEVDVPTFIPSIRIADCRMTAATQ
jgi:PmbA protein